MELLSSADAIVRRILPAMLDAAGSRSAAGLLRELGPIACHRSVLTAATTLKSVRRLNLRSSSNHVKDATFWCEKAVWAAASSDHATFTRYVDHAHAAVREEMSLPRMLN